MGELKKHAGAGLAFALFLASGGIGYLLSVVHHTLHNCNRWWLLCWLPLNWTRRWLTVVDHTTVINELLDAGLLDVRRFDGGTVKIDRTTDKIDRTTAWVMVTAVWKENLDDSCNRLVQVLLCDMSLVNERHLPPVQPYAYAQLPLQRVWGSCKSAAADGTKWDLYPQNLMSEYHIRE